MRFRTTIQLEGKTATGFRVPPEVVDGLGHGKRPPVRVTIGGHTYRSTVAALRRRLHAPARRGAPRGRGRRGRRRGGGRRSSSTSSRARSPCRPTSPRRSTRRGCPALLRRPLLQQPAAVRPLDRGREDGRDPPAADRRGGRAPPRGPNLAIPAAGRYTPRPMAIPSPSLIHARGLTKRFGGLTAVDAIDFDVAPGESFGFLGPNGAGKTSAMRMIACVSPMTGGHAQRAGDGPARRRARGSGPGSASSPSRTRWTWS